MDPSGGMDFVSLQGTVVWVDASKVHILAEIISAIRAEEAVPTGHTRLHGDTITFLHVTHFAAYQDNDPGCFVSKYTIATYNQTANPSSFPKVDI
jgi:hypothetical protein